MDCPSCDDQEWEMIVVKSPMVCREAKSERV